VTGYLVPFEPDAVTGFPVDGDKFSRDLARRIAELMANPALCEKFGRAGRKRVEETFAWEAIAKQTVELYRSLVQK
jgi:alpha-maltose-1-phosphate synthase